MPTSKRKKARPSAPAVAVTTAAPPVDEALNALFRRTVRAWVWLLVRIVALGLLVAVLSAQIAWVRQNRPIMDALSGVFALWPFFTGLGRIHSWRIALGRAYVQEKRWGDAERTLSHLTGYRARLFDAAGEGAYWLAVARRASSRPDEARRLFQQVAESHPGSEWGEKARHELAAGETATKTNAATASSSS